MTMTQNKPRKSSKMLLEEKHMKSYFRSLKRSNQNQRVESSQVKNRIKENESNKNKKVKIKPQTSGKNSKKSQSPKNQKNKNNAEREMSLNENDFQRESTMDVEQIMSPQFDSIEAQKEEILDSEENMSLESRNKGLHIIDQQFNEANFWKTPFTDIDIDITSSSSHFIDDSHNDITETETNAEETIQNSDSSFNQQFNSVAYWREPLHLMEIVDHDVI